MLSYRLGTVNDFHWEFKPVLSYSKTHTFSRQIMTRITFANVWALCSTQCGKHAT